MAITAIFLAAGYATRLYPLTKDRPKTLLPLGKGVILDEALRAVQGVPGVTQRVLVTNHVFAAQFRAWRRARRANVRILDDGTSTPQTRLGAIRDLDLAWRCSASRSDLLVLGTDNLFTWPLADFVARARRHSPEPSVALWKAPSKAAVSQFGVVTRDRASRLTGFAEKSSHPPSTDVALCVYYFPSAMCGTIRQFLASGGNADAPGYFIQWLARTGTVYGIPMRGMWYDIGTFESYQTVVTAWRHQAPARSARTRRSTTRHTGGTR